MDLKIFPAGTLRIIDDGLHTKIKKSSEKNKLEMPMSEKSSIALPKIRKHPKLGVILRYILPDGLNAYFCSVLRNKLWLYDFFTDYPTRQTDYFNPSHWKTLVHVSFMGFDFVDVAKITLTEKQTIPPETYQFASAPLPINLPRSASMVGKSLDGGYYLMRVKWEDAEHNLSGSSLTIVSREETIGRVPENLVMAEKMSEWLTAQASNMSLLHIPPQHRDFAAMDKQPADDSETEENESIIIEIEFPWKNDGLVKRRHEIEDELITELEDHGSGTVIGSGVMGGPKIQPNEAAFDFAVEVEPKRLKSALRIIRKVLKHFNAPADTVIRETRSANTAPIEHSLEPPKK